MTQKVRDAIETMEDILQEEDVSDAHWFQRMEDAAREAGSKNPNSDVWKIIQNN